MFHDVEQSHDVERLAGEARLLQRTHDNMYTILGFCNTRCLCRKVHAERPKPAALQQSEKRRASATDIQQVETVAIPGSALNEFHQY